MEEKEEDALVVNEEEDDLLVVAEKEGDLLVVERSWTIVEDDRHRYRGPRLHSCPSGRSPISLFDCCVFSCVLARGASRIDSTRSRP